MATPIRIKRSAVAGKVPEQGALQYGELAYNIHDAELYAVRNRVGVGSYVARLGAGATVTNILYVTQDGKDTNTGQRLGEAKRTIGAATTVAGEGTIIKVSAGSYLENNPIVLPKQVSIVGDSIREVSVTPQNQGDLFYVTTGNYFSDLSFTGPANNGAIFAFNPNKPDYINQSPYIRNCTNFIPNSIGIRANGKHAIGPTKSIVTDSFTQYNANGIGVSITNEAYCQIVDMFTICSNISVYAAGGGQCDVNGCNSSFGNYGLVSSGIGTIKYTGLLQQATSKNAQEFIVDISEPVFEISNIQYDNNTGLATVSLVDPHNYIVGVAITIGGALFNTNQGGLVELPHINENNVFEVNSVISNTQFTSYLGPSTLTGYAYSAFSSDAYTSKYSVRPYNGQIVYFDLPYYYIARATISNPGSGYLTAPTLTISPPNTDFGIPPIILAQIENGSVSSVEIAYPGRGYANFFPNIIVSSPETPGGTTAVIDVQYEPIFYTVSSSTPVVAGVTTVTLNEAVPYEFSFGQNLDFHVQSKILATSHGFEYVGSGVTISTAVPSRGGVAIENNQVDQRDGGIVVYTATDQLGKFKIGDGIVIDQTTGTISGNDYTRNLFTTLTPLILALGD